MPGLCHPSAPRLLIKVLRFSGKSHHLKSKGPEGWDAEARGSRTLQARIVRFRFESCWGPTRSILLGSATCSGLSTWAEVLVGIKGLCRVVCLPVFPNSQPGEAQGHKPSSSEGINSFLLSQAHIICLPALDLPKELGRHEAEKLRSGRGLPDVHLLVRSTAKCKNSHHYGGGVAMSKNRHPERGVRAARPG